MEIAVAVSELVVSFEILYKIESLFFTLSNSSHLSSSAYDIITIG